MGEHHGAPGALLHRRYCGLRTATAVKCLSDNEDFNVVYLVTFPTWRTSGEVAPVDGADGAASVEVAADGNPANNQSPEADGWSNDNVSLAPTDPKAPPISVGCAQSIEPTEAERIAQSWCESCVRGRGGCVRGRGRDETHRRRQDQMRDTQQQSFSATILLQRGEGGHHMQEN